MKRFHLHVSVKSLPESIAFYSRLFSTAPSVTKSDYAQWMIEDPRINFAISQRGHEAGLSHLGFPVDSDDELQVLRDRVAKAGIAALDEGGVRSFSTFMSKTL